MHEINLKNFQFKKKDFTIFQKIFLSPFCKEVLEEISKIPYRKKLSYVQVAKNISKSKAYRAVGIACKNNPIPIVIPCHRVILRDGQIGDYAGGFKLKARLLKREII